MPGISDLLDSDIEGGINYINENSLISSPSDTTEIASQKQLSVAKKQPKKRHRVTMPKSKSKVVKSSPAAAPKRPTHKATSAKRKAIEQQVDEDADTDEDSIWDRADQMEEVAPEISTRGRGSTRDKAVHKHAVTRKEEPVTEIEEVSATARSNHAQVRSANPAPKVAKGVGRPKKKSQLDSIVETQQSATMDLDSDNDELETMAAPQPVKVRPDSRSRQDAMQRRRAGSASDAERGDPHLRRRLGDVTRKFENIDAKYRNLKDVGLNEANMNVEKLRRQCEATAEASNNLVSSLKKELALQGPLANEARKLKRDVQSQAGEIEQLKSANAGISASLTAAQNEIKTLQAKLAAARKAPSAEPVPAKPPGSAIKGSVAARTTASGNSEASQHAQMKLDLYGDLTGLIIRGVKRAEDGDTYDCIQTGRNGTLHFKLFIDHEDARSASFEETEFLYTPLLDADRDHDMIELMPPYLTEDITFARQNAAKFYQRVVDTLTRRTAEAQ